MMWVTRVGMHLLFVDLVSPRLTPDSSKRLVLMVLDVGKVGTSLLCRVLVLFSGFTHAQSIYRLLLIEAFSPAPDL